MHDLRGICRDYLIYKYKGNLKINNMSDFYFYGTFKELIIDYNGKECHLGNLELQKFRDKYIINTPKNGAGSYYYKIPIKQLKLDYNKVHLIPIVFNEIKKGIKEIYTALDKVSLRNLPREHISQLFTNYPSAFREKAIEKGHFYWTERRYK
ncbi:MAG: hypothetical protein ACPLXC_00040 [Candidatus Pacearchaeota archaeon]